MRGEIMRHQYWNKVNDKEQYSDVDEAAFDENYAKNKTLAELNPFRYRGYYYDEETGLYYLKSRYYDPEAGRFITIDDISYIDPDTINGLNLYAYCGNNPVMNVDPNGCSWNSFWNNVGNWFKKVGNGISNFFSNSLPNWWNNTKIKLGTWVGDNIIDPMRNGLQAAGDFFKSTLPNWWKNTVVSWWKQIQIDLGMWVVSWMKPVEAVMYKFAEFMQENVLLNIALGVIGVALPDFAGFLLTGISVWSLIMVKVGKKG